MTKQRIAVLLPCYNEAVTIEKVIDDFRAELPHANIYVYDNNSTDGTADIARSKNVVVKNCRRQGKGMVVRQMFNEIDADIYVMSDGDDTYLASDVHALLAPILDDQCDMCIGNRLIRHSGGSFSPVHYGGNRLICFLMRRFYNTNIDDMLSGFRVFTRELVDDLKLISAGFEIETELNIKTVWHGYKIMCVPVEYSARPVGSFSKIRTFIDGYRILATLFMLLREYQPVTMGGIFFLACLALSATGISIGWYYGVTPLLMLGCTVCIFGTLVLCTGVVIHAINISYREADEHRRKMIRRILQGRRSDS